MRTPARRGCPSLWRRNSWRCSRYGQAIVLALVVSLAPKDTAATERFRDWTLLTLGANDCVLHHRAIALKAGLVLADVFLSPLPDHGVLISLRVPRGASLTDRAAYRHPRRASAVPLIWQSCNLETCLAQVGVDAGERRRLERGRAVDLAFVPLPGATPLSFSISLLGVTRGLEAAEACLGPGDPVDAEAFGD